MPLIKAAENHRAEVAVLYVALQHVVGRPSPEGISRGNDRSFASPGSKTPE